MKAFTYTLLFLLPLAGFCQQSKTPEVVFPLVEQFISEAHARQIPVYQRIRQIDSIAVEKLPFPLTGLHLKGASYESITLHKDAAYTPRQIEKSFYHEVGHIFGLAHTGNRTQIMYDAYNPWFDSNTNWQKAKDEYFTQLKNAAK